MTDTIDEFLDHSGVKGMKWGVRKVRNSKSGSKGKTKFQKAPSRLSDAELKRRIGRLEMEKKYGDLNARQKSSGEKLASEILTGAAKGVAITALTGVGMLAVKTVLSKKGIKI